MPAGTRKPLYHKDLQIPHNSKLRYVANKPGGDNDVIRGIHNFNKFYLKMRIFIKLQRQSKKVRYMPNLFYCDRIYFRLKI